MRTIRAAVALALLLLVGALWSPFSTAYAASSHGSRPSRSTKNASSRKTVRVRSYTRKNGTVVAAHTRSAPHPRSTTSTSTRSTVAARSRTSSTVKAIPTTKAGRPSGSRASQEVTAGRMANGRIARSEAAKRQFMRQTGYPKGRPGYVIDHVRPLACGGADSPSNMQWQTIAEGKAKDKTEPVGCR
jgi:cytoskeletal protein RodZ